MQSDRDHRRVCFQVRAPYDQAVYVAGTFNGWNSRQYRLWQGPFGQGEHRAHLSLPPGRYEYKFVSGMEWYPDPENPNRVNDGYGSVNSVLTVM